MCRAQLKIAFGDDSTDDYMVRMTVGSVWAKGNHHIRSKGTDNLGDVSGQCLWISILQGPIAIVEAKGVLYTEYLTGAM